MKLNETPKLLNRRGRAPLRGSEVVVEGLLGNHKAKKYKGLVEDLAKTTSRWNIKRALSCTSFTHISSSSIRP